VPFSEENVERFAEFLRDCGGGPTAYALRR